jgi:hypothetical protein
LLDPSLAATPAQRGGDLGASAPQPWGRSSSACCVPACAMRWPSGRQPPSRSLRLTN